MRSAFVFVVVLVAALALAVGVTPATADQGGNATAAHLCQQGGWQNLVREDETPFKNAGECISYAARGGALAPANPAARLLCESFGGVFGLGDGGKMLWTCTYTSNNAAFLALANQCSADTGNAPGTSFQIISGDVFGVRTDACFAP